MYDWNKAQSETNTGNRLEARRIANDCYRYIMDLCTNAGVISDAMKFVDQKREQLDTSNPNRINEEENVQTETETNGLF